MTVMKHTESKKGMMMQGMMMRAMVKPGTITAMNRRKSRQTTAGGRFSCPEEPRRFLTLHKFLFLTLVLLGALAIAPSFSYAQGEVSAEEMQNIQMRALEEMRTQIMSQDINTEDDEDFQPPVTEEMLLNRALPAGEEQGAQDEDRAQPAGTNRVYRYNQPKDPYLQGVEMPKRLFGNVSGPRSLADTADSGLTVFVNRVPYTKSVKISPETPIVVRFKHKNPAVKAVFMPHPDDPEKSKLYALDKNARIIAHENSMKQGRSAQATFIAVDDKGKAYDRLTVTLVP